MEELLFRLDPVGLNFETNTDEYSSEVGTILPRLKDAKSDCDVLTIVQEEFAHWFNLSDDQLARLKYHELAVEIWRLWREHMEPSVKR